MPMTDGSSADPFERLLERSQLARVEDMPSLLAEVAPLVGASELRIFVADYAQRQLVSLELGPLGAERPLPIEGTLAGRAFRDLDLHSSPQEHGCHVWLPLLDGVERLGVLEAALVDEPGEAGIRRLRALALLIATILTTRSQYGDALELVRRRLPMSLAAELQWTQLPPLTYATEDVVISGVLEPSYDIGGDSFDYAVNGRTLHAALFDAVGHGIVAAQQAALALAAYRNGRRSGLDLVDTAHSVDRWLSQQFPEDFVTGILLELDTATGQLRIINAGHPEVLIFRGGHLVRALPGPTRVPLGLGTDVDKDLDVAVEALQPDDQLLLYSDGIVEARAEDGEEFGQDRLVDFMGRQLIAKLPVAETLRGLVNRILEHQKDELQDDATALLIEWSSAAVR